MGTFDKGVISQLEPEIDMKSVSLGDILDPDNGDPFECLIALYAERYACNADYTIDLPVYMVTEGKTYLGHVVGEHTQQELQTQLQKIVSGASNQEGEVAAPQ